MPFPRAPDHFLLAPHTTASAVLGTYKQLAVFLECICVLFMAQSLITAQRAQCQPGADRVYDPTVGSVLRLGSPKQAPTATRSQLGSQGGWQEGIGSSLYSLCTGTRVCEDTGLSFTSGSAPGSWPFLQGHSSHLSLGTRVDNTEGPWD